ncbi:MAG: hypothetical protein KJZ69_03365 [Phycisphaerales bacterium]|nr:hypothetical protein [Phycisphaerales bacterium]
MNWFNRILTAAGALMALTFAPAALADGLTLYVRAEGSDANDGFSSASALRSIQRAVALATGSGNTIIVGPGVYYESISIGSGGGEPAGSGTADGPNRLLADPGGARTGDLPGPVVIEGDGVRERGVRLQDRRHWRIEGLTLHGQTRAAIEARRADGLTIESCFIHVPFKVGVEVRETAGVRIAHNAFIRDLEGGTCISLQLEESDEPPRDDRGGRDRAGEDDGGHDDDRDEARDDTYDGGRSDGADDDDARAGPGRRGRRGDHPTRPGARAEVEANRLALAGPLYLAGSMHDSGAAGRRRGGDELFGIDVRAEGRDAILHIANNVISDCTVGVRVRIDDAEAAAVVAHNSIAGCRTGVDVEAKKGSVLAADNIIAHCHVALAAEGRTDRLTISGLLACDVRVLVRGRGHAVIEGLIESAEPRWIDPAFGNFAPAAGSPAIDAGIGSAAVGDDLLGRVRPIDGDGDGRARIDLGAVERDPDSDALRSLQLVRWREIER